MNLSSNCLYSNAVTLNVKLQLTAKFYYALLCLLYLLFMYFQPTMNSSKFHCSNNLKQHLVDV